jgi:two-component system CheB/CheR fusion protein
MRTRPYRTSQNVIDGVVITFVDITHMKQVEAAERAARQWAEAVAATIRTPLLTLDREFRIRSANRAFCQTFRTRPEEVEGHTLFEIQHRRWDLPELRQLLGDILSTGRVVENLPIDYGVPPEYEIAGLGPLTKTLNARRIEIAGDDLGVILVLN